MNVYGTPDLLTQIRAPRGATSLSRARRAIKAAKHSKGWRRQAYLQDAVEHLAAADRLLSLVRYNDPRDSESQRSNLVDATFEFAEEATHEEHLAAIAQVVRESSSTTFCLALC